MFKNCMLSEKICGKLWRRRLFLLFVNTLEQVLESRVIPAIPPVKKHRAASFLLQLSYKCFNQKS